MYCFILVKLLWSLGYRDKYAPAKFSLGGTGNILPNQLNEWFYDPTQCQKIKFSNFPKNFDDSLHYDLPPLYWR